MVSRRDRPLQTWKTFLCNHMEGIASIDLFVVPTIALSNCSRFLFSVIDGERVLADIDSDHGNGSVEFLRHGVLLVFGAPCWLRLLISRPDCLTATKRPSAPIMSSMAATLHCVAPDPGDGLC
jgi:hypothetical protein